MRRKAPPPPPLALARRLTSLYSSSWVLSKSMRTDRLSRATTMEAAVRDTSTVAVMMPTPTSGAKTYSTTNAGLRRWRESGLK